MAFACHNIEEKGGKKSLPQARIRGKGKRCKSRNRCTEIKDLYLIEKKKVERSTQGAFNARYVCLCMN